MAAEVIPAFVVGQISVCYTIAMRDRMQSSDSAASLIASCLLLLLAARLCGTPARACALDSSQLHAMLRVRAGATCLSSESLAPHIAEWLSNEQLPRDFAIEVEGSERDPYSASFRVVVAGQTTARRVFDRGLPSCESLRATVGLAIALALKASSLEVRDLPRAREAQARTAGFSLSAAGMASYEVLPGFAPGLEIRTQYELAGMWSLRAGVFALVASGVELARTGAVFDAGLIAGRLDACVRHALTGALESRFCAGLPAGVIYARGRRIAAPESSLRAWVAFAAAAALALAVTERWTLELELSVSVPLRPLRIGVENANGDRVEGRSLASVGVLLGLGPRYHF